jgi:aminoglycoside phosphotransferase (APT) family kinase protein
MVDASDSTINGPAPTGPADESHAGLAQRLLQYQRVKTQNTALAFAEAPERITGGFDTAIFGFRLAGARPPFTEPLVLRLFRASRSADEVKREAIVQNALAGMAYPAARVFSVETDPTFLDGPFLIMERLRGQTLGLAFEGLGEGRSAIGLVRLILEVPLRMRRTVALWSQAQLALHALPAEEFAGALEAAGLDRRDFSLDTQLATMRHLIAEAGLVGLAPGVAWLNAQRPAAVPAVICHGDFHPFNILVADERIAGVVDWSGVIIADPALDLGSALAITATVPIAASESLRPIIRAIMRAFGRRFVRAYCRSRPLDAPSLRYFEIYCCLRQLLWVGLAAAAGNPRVGAYGSPEGVRNLIAHIRAVAGLKVDLPVFSKE